MTPEKILEKHFNQKHHAETFPPEELNGESHRFPFSSCKPSPIREVPSIDEF